MQIKNTLNLILLSIILLLLVSTGFWYNINEWDEARHGANAFFMAQNGDYINLYFDNLPDTWIAKPPLLTWMIVGSYKLFGYNEFALRLPTYICVLIFFSVMYRFVCQYTKPVHAFLCCLITASCKLVIGWHIGLTADYDMILVLMLLLSVYYYARYIDFDKQNAIYLSALFIGLAFYCKGTAAFVLLPGMALYAMIRGKMKNLLRSKQLWIALGVLIAIIGSWLGLLSVYGLAYQSSYYNSNNAITTLFLHDTIRRLADSSFEDKSTPDKFFALTVLDVRLNVWNYLLYLLLAIGLVRWWQQRKHTLSLIKDEQNRMVLLSLCLIVPFTLLMSFSETKHDWYLIPAYIFIPPIIMDGIIRIGKRTKTAYYVFGIVLTFTFTRHTLYLYNQPKSLHTHLNRQNPYLKDCPKLVTISIPRHHVYLYLQWMDLHTDRVQHAEELNKYKGRTLLIDQGQMQEVKPEQITILQRFDEFILARIN
ncbi:hypothetical protein CAP35_11630 [Chitinophagaceae bacterium IBVUCB1]|nr:hypothetical protein CAP35_11630 [Chitinophagaceae bacterium IBVUCB1]